MNNYKLNVIQVSRIAGCHRNTVLRFEAKGFITPVRDINGWRRFTEEDAMKLKDVFQFRTKEPYGKRFDKGDNRKRDFMIKEVK